MEKRNAEPAFNTPQKRARISIANLTADSPSAVVSGSVGNAVEATAESPTSKSATEGSLATAQVYVVMYQQSGKHIETETKVQGAYRDVSSAESVGQKICEHYYDSECGYEEPWTGNNRFTMRTWKFKNDQYSETKIWIEELYVHEDDHWEPSSTRMY